MKSSLIILLISLCVCAQSQTMRVVRDRKYRNMADSLINVRLDSSLTSGLRYSRTWETFMHRCLEPKIDSLSDTIPKFTLNPDRIKFVNVYYDFITSCGQKYGYQTKGFTTSGGFEFTFDFDYNLVCEPNYELFTELLKAHQYRYISYRDAQKIARKNTKRKSRKTWTNYLIYDTRNNQMYWWIERETGFRNGTTKELRIDAVNGDVIEKIEMPFRKRFFEAVSDIVFGSAIIIIQ